MCVGEGGLVKQWTDPGGTLPTGGVAGAEKAGEHISVKGRGGEKKTRAKLLLKFSFLSTKTISSGGGGALMCSAAPQVRRESVPLS